MASTTFYAQQAANRRESLLLMIIVAVILGALAFATGRDPQHASLAITTGLLEKLDREELQGVIGHELGHVRNYDIRFMLLVGVLVGGIALLADMFLRYTFWFGGGRRRSRDDNG